VGSKRRTIAELRRLVRRHELLPAQLRRLKRDPRAGARSLAARELARIHDERERLDALLLYERALWRRGVRWVAGVDEAGAGPLAGPVVAAAVILPKGTRIEGIDDSKKLSRAKREQLELVIRERAIAYAVGICTPEEIDAINILQASRLAMARAVAALRPVPQYLLVDARNVPHMNMPQTPIIHGDSISQSIAAASIVAKVYRDALMTKLACTYPGYGFERHAGYGTRVHMDALANLGPSPVHRRSFAPVAAVSKVV